MRIVSVVALPMAMVWANLAQGDVQVSAGAVSTTFAGGESLALQLAWPATAKVHAAKTGGGDGDLTLDVSAIWCPYGNMAAPMDPVRFWFPRMLSAGWTYDSPWPPGCAASARLLWSDHGRFPASNPKRVITNDVAAAAMSAVVSQLRGALTNMGMEFWLTRVWVEPDFRGHVETGGQNAGFGIGIQFHLNSPGNAGSDVTLALSGSVVDPPQSIRFENLGVSAHDTSNLNTDFWVFIGRELAEGICFGDCDCIMSVADGIPTDSCGDDVHFDRGGTYGETCEDRMFAAIVMYELNRGFCPAMETRADGTTCCAQPRVTVTNKQLLLDLASNGINGQVPLPNACFQHVRTLLNPVDPACTCPPEYPNCGVSCDWITHVHNPATAVEVEKVVDWRLAIGSGDADCDGIADQYDCMPFNPLRSDDLDQDGVCDLPLDYAQVSECRRYCDVLFGTTVSETPCKQQCTINDNCVDARHPKCAAERLCMQTASGCVPDTAVCEELYSNPDQREGCGQEALQFLRVEPSRRGSGYVVEVGRSFSIDTRLVGGKPVDTDGDGWPDKVDAVGRYTTVGVCPCPGGTAWTDECKRLCPRDREQPVGGVANNAWDPIPAPECTSVKFPQSNSCADKYWSFQRCALADANCELTRRHGLTWSWAETVDSDTGALLGGRLNQSLAELRGAWRAQPADGFDDAHKRFTDPFRVGVQFVVGRQPMLSDPFPRGINEYDPRDTLIERFDARTWLLQYDVAAGAAFLARLDARSGAVFDVSPLSYASAYETESQAPFDVKEFGVAAGAVPGALLGGTQPEVGAVFAFGGERADGTLSGALWIGLPDLGNAWVAPPQGTKPSNYETVPGPRRAPHVLFDANRGRVLVLGGLLPDGSARNDLWAYSLTALTWRRLGTLPIPADLTGYSASLDVRRDRLLVFGGRSEGSESASLYSFDFAELGMYPRPVTTPLAPRADHAMLLEPASDAVFVYGGAAGKQALSDAWRLDLKTGAWQLLAGEGGAAPAGRANALLSYDRLGAGLLITGGETAGQAATDVWRLATRTGVWQKSPQPVTLTPGDGALTSAFSAELPPEIGLLPVDAGAAYPGQLTLAELSSSQALGLTIEETELFPVAQARGATTEEAAFLAQPGVTYHVRLSPAPGFDPALPSDYSLQTHLAELRQVATFKVGRPFVDVAVSGSLAVVAGPSGLAVLDLSVPAAPVQTDRVNLPLPYRVAATDGHAYVATAGHHNVWMVDLRDPHQARASARIHVPGLVSGLAALGQMLFVAAGPNGVQVVDLANQAGPTVSGSWEAPGHEPILDVAAAGTRLVAVSARGTVYVLDPKDGAPEAIASTAILRGAFSVSLFGSRAHVATLSGGGVVQVEVIDISDPAEPRRVGGYVAGLFPWVKLVGAYAFQAGWRGLEVYHAESP
ncbi:MAG TPA: kelch repeat-containing protein [Polyangia bacterium]|jgi:hypothetical protein